MDSRARFEVPQDRTRATEDFVIGVWRKDQSGRTGQRFGRCIWGKVSFQEGVVPSDFQ
jgi:hypothetical protein